MRKKNHIRKFTPEQVAVLAANPFTYKVNAMRITYTLEFKNLFMSRCEAGYDTMVEIFEDLGYDTDILGHNRIYTFASRLAKQIESGEIPAETPSAAKREKPVNIDYNTMPAQQSISAMQREIAYLRQQLEFVKKITELDKDKKQRT
jgi:hypothetical protein